ncbi:MAG: aromatic ring-hydroxylating dioxygenase subunit alpha [Acidiferrobacterales bacterium]|nr:aromatic ring-hydroxylating dioxygenase subunit alpha [Acidiferrobacterales bacterium]
MGINLENISKQLERVRPPVASAATLPPLCYTEEAWAKKEYERIFAHAWISIGRRERWKSPGDFICVELAGTPLIITQDEDSHLHALANTCSHRGMKLKSGSGNCRQLVCPFHAWTYALDGKLISAPRMEHCTLSGSEFVNHDFDLTTVRVEESSGFVFLCLDAEQQSLEDWLADFGELHAPWKLKDLVTTRVSEFDVRCNWKSFIEVFNEYYHLPYVHPNSLSGLYQEPDAADIVMGEYTTQFGITEGTAALLEESQTHALPSIPTLRGREREGTRYTWIYPNLTFAACSDSLWMYHVFPSAVNRCHVVQTVCFPSSSVSLPDFEVRAQRYYDRIDEAIAEDLPFLELQQEGLASPLAKQGRFSTLEPSVGNFACWYANQMR